MKPTDLDSTWDIPNNGRLTPKQMSIRLPILVAAKISALCEMYPRKAKSEIIIDLISTSLEQLEESLPSEKGAFIENESSFSETGELHNFSYSIFEDIGKKGRFISLTEKYLRNIEKENDFKEALPYKTPYVSEKDFSGNHGHE